MLMLMLMHLATDRRRCWFHRSPGVNISCWPLDDVHVCVHVDEHLLVFVTLVEYEDEYEHAHDLFVVAVVVGVGVYGAFGKNSWTG